MSVNLLIASELSESQIPQLLTMYHHELWSKDRGIKDVRIILQTSKILALVNSKDDEIIAFARFLSDGIYRAMIYDVIVAQKYRGLGYGRVLLEALIADERLNNIERVELYCQNKNVSFYKKFGFQEVPEGTYLMRKAR